MATHSFDAMEENSDGPSTTQQIASTTTSRNDLFSVGSAILDTVKYKLNASQLQLQQICFEANDSGKIINTIQSLSNENNLEAFIEALKPLVCILYYSVQQNGPDQSNTSAHDCQEPDEIDRDQIQAPAEQTTMDIDEMIQSGIPVETHKFMELKFSHEPGPFWHARFITCLMHGKCPGLTGRTEKENEDHKKKLRYIQIQCKSLNEQIFDPKKLFVSVEILTFDKKVHPMKNIVPPGTKVNQSQNPTQPRESLTVDNLIIDEKYQFDKQTKRIIYPFQQDKNNPDQMSVKVLVFNSETNEKVKPGKSDQENIEFLLNKIFKIRLQMLLLEDEELKPISNSIDTKFIEESKQTKELEVKRCEFVKHDPLSIEVEFNTNCDQNGFQISVNERKLEFGKAFRLNKTTMTITAEEFRDDFCLLISKSSAMETILRGLDPRKSPILNKEAVITYEKSGKLRITRDFH